MLTSYQEQQKVATWQPMVLVSVTRFQTKLNITLELTRHCSDICCFCVYYFITIMCR